MLRYRFGNKDTKRLARSESPKPAKAGFLDIVSAAQSSEKKAEEGARKGFAKFVAKAGEKKARAGFTGAVQRGVPSTCCAKAARAGRSGRDAAPTHRERAGPVPRANEAFGFTFTGFTSG